MPVSVIVGGQYGSEGKGKVANYFAKQQGAAAVVRVGGPNSGHTVIADDGTPIIFKHLSTASIIPGIKSVLTSANYLNLKILNDEIAISKIQDEDLKIDPFAVIITDDHIRRERELGLINSIGSTGCGLGMAITDKISRNKEILFAKDIPALEKYLCNTTFFLRELLEVNQRIIIEGTQGFGLSLNHSNVYPFCTSRDTTAANFIAEAGLSPIDVDEIIMVIRAFPIRVSGNSGPLVNEVNWEYVSDNSGCGENFYELTSVSNKIRRIAKFDSDIVKRAILYNRPTKIVLNHLDYFDKQNTQALSDRMLQELKKIEVSINRKVDYVGIDRFGLIETKNNVYS